MISSLTAFKLYNDTFSDLLFDLCTNSDAFTRDRIEAVIKWVEKLDEEESAENLLLRATHRYCGFVKCIASILWTAHTTQLVTNLEELITEELFESVFQWTTVLTDNDPFRQAIDSMLCSICAIRPELFQNLLAKLGIRPPETNMSDDRKAATMNREEEEQQQFSENEIAGGLLTRDQLLTLAMACQSKLAVQQLIDSGLPFSLARYCANVFRKESSTVVVEDEEEEEDVVRMEVDDDIIMENVATTETNAETETRALSTREIVNCRNIIDFFSEVCSEGLMRDWLGSEDGACFWYPLLYRLCHARLLNDKHEIETQFMELEKATIQFLSSLTTCHPQNQELVTRILIQVIRKPESVRSDRHIGARQSISGFTRRLILDLLLENEKILVAVHSSVQLTKKEQSVHLSNHPSKRPNAHNVYLVLSTNAKAIEVLDNCRPVYGNIDFNHSGATATSAQAEMNFDEMIRKDDNKLLNGLFGELSDSNLLGAAEGVGVGSAAGGIASEDGKPGGYWKTFTSSLIDMDQTQTEMLSVAAGVTAKDKRLKDVKNHAAVLRAKESMSEFRLHGTLG